MTKPVKSVVLADRSPAQVKAVNEAVARIKRGTNEMLLGLYDFARLKGWEVTGHPNFAAWAESIDWTSSTAYRKLAAGEVLHKMTASLGLSGAAVVEQVRVPAALSAKLAALPAATFDDVVAETSAVLPAAEPQAVAREIVTRLEQRASVKPDKVMAGPRVAAKFRQLTLSLDALTAEVVPDDREAVRELYEALGERLTSWGML